MRPTITLVLLSALATGCNVDPLARVEEIAGAEAHDCGYAPSLDERGGVIRCGLAADAAGLAWYGGWRSIGRDTEIRDYRSRDGDGNAWLLRYSSDRPNRLAGVSCGDATYQHVTMPPPVGDDLTCVGGGREVVDLALGP